MDLENRRLTKWVDIDEDARVKIAYVSPEDLDRINKGAIIKKGDQETVDHNKRTLDLVKFAIVDIEGFTRGDQELTVDDITVLIEFAPDKIMELATLAQFYDAFLPNVEDVVKKYLPQLSISKNGQAETAQDSTVESA